MKSLFLFLSVLLPCSLFAAVPDYAAFRGTNQVLVTTNPSTGKIVIGPATPISTIASNAAKSLMVWTNPPGPAVYLVNPTNVIFLGDPSAGFTPISQYTMSAILDRALGHDYNEWLFGVLNSTNGDRSTYDMYTEIGSVSRELQSSVGGSVYKLVDEVNSTGLLSYWRGGMTATYLQTDTDPILEIFNYGLGDDIMTLNSNGLMVVKYLNSGASLFNGSITNTALSPSKLVATGTGTNLTSSAYSDTDIANLQGGTNGLNTAVGNLQSATNQFGNTNRFIASQSGKGTNNNLFQQTNSMITGATVPPLLVQNTNTLPVWQVDTNSQGVTHLGTNTQGQLTSSNNASTTNSSFQSGGNAPSIYIGAGGNVGVNTNNPAQALEVQGNVNVSGKTTNSGGLYWLSDASGDIGSQTVNRPGNIFAATGIRSPSTRGDIVWFAQAGTAGGKANSDGVLQLFGNSQTDFGRLQFGGTTAAFPALGRTNGDIVVFGGDGLFAGASTNRLIVQGSIVAQSPVNIPTNAALIKTIAPASLHNVALGKGWTNDLGARADLVLAVKLADAATGDPALAFTNTVTGEAWTNSIGGGLVQTHQITIVIPDLSTNDYGSFTDISTGSGSTLTILNAWWKLK